MDKPKIYKPSAMHGHSGDTFRQLIDGWQELGYVEVLESPDRYVWWNEPGDILLHDLPLIYDVVTSLPEYKHALYGNMQNDGDNDHPWIFWGREPKVLQHIYETKKKVKPQYRMWESMFVGKIENQLQADNRFQSKIDWSKHIQNFMVVKGVQAPYPYSQADYIYNMSVSKFALLLPGYGPKCNRDIEAMACGAIPIVTPGVDTTYYNEWVEGENYIRMNEESDLEDIFDTPNDVLEEIQQRNYEWYEANSTVVGSFNTTKEIIEGLK